MTNAASHPAPTAREPERTQAVLRVLEILLLGALFVAGLQLRIQLAYRYTPGMDLPVGPDVDDWLGVFWGVTHHWPPTWDAEWSRRFPLLALAGLAGARLCHAPILVVVQQIGILAGSTLAPLTYLLGRRIVGRPAALAAACWMVFQDGLTSQSVATTAYSLSPPLYLLLLLGLVGLLEEPTRRGAAVIAGVATFLLVTALLQGVMILGVTLVALGLVVLPSLWRRPDRLRQAGRLLAPPALGLAGAVPVLLAFPCRIEISPAQLWGRFAENYHHTWLYEVPVAVRTGYRVERLLAGTSRLEHFRLTVSEQLGLPLSLLLAAVGVMLAVSVARRHRPGAAGRALLAVLLAGPAYGWVANSSDFHFFHWFPTLALAITAGLVGWTRFLPGRVLPRALRWALAVVFVGVLLRPPPPQQPGPAQHRYSYLRGQYEENAKMARMCQAAAGVVSTRGTLIVAVEHAWQYRVYMLGGGELVDLRELLPRQERISALPRPVYLLAPLADAETTVGQIHLAGTPRLLQRFDRAHLPSFVQEAGLYLVQERAAVPAPAPTEEP